MSIKTIDSPAPVEAPAAPGEQPKPLKLSEAIRLGSINTVQVHGTWTDDNAEGEPAMCVISTAWYALTGGAEDSGENSALHGLLSRHTVKHPLYGDDAPLSEVLITLNDAGKWSRPQIADWLETLGL